jgi:hypothetical protein
MWDCHFNTMNLYSYPVFYERPSHSAPAGPKISSKKWQEKNRTFGFTTLSYGAQALSPWISQAKGILFYGLYPHWERQQKMLGKFQLYGRYENKLFSYVK